jgi:3-phosphoglycerate kinase
MKTVRDISILNNIPVLLRCSLNVPVENGTVVDSFRLRRALPTIRYLQEKGARVILASHVSGENKATGIGTETLRPVWEAMKEFLPRITFSETATGKDARKAVRALHPGDVLMLENLRRNAGEVKNDPAFAQELAALADVFVQDSFDNCHREHASMVTVPKLLPSYAGFVVEEEVRELTKALSPARPSIALICGVKFTTKEPVVTKLLKTYDRVYVGGALANDFLQAGGHSVGKSLVSGGDDSHIRALLQNPQLLLPLDVIVSASENRNAARVAELDSVQKNDVILDAGPKTVEMLAHAFKNAKSILWNGPLGKYENGFTDATEGVARAVAASGAYSVVGGGDTVAAIEKLGEGTSFSFISTGGGAMLDFLAEGSLPALTVLG